MANLLPRDARRALFVYNLFFPVVFLALLPGFLARMIRRGSFREKFGERLGRYATADIAQLKPGEPVWIHSISVGETLIAVKLARVWREHEPALRVVLSVTTTTGFAIAREAIADWLIPIYNPVDFLPIVRRAFDRFNPRKIVLIEGEAWPNFLAEAHRRSIPVSLVDARLSPRSELRFRRFRAWTGPIFRLLRCVCVPVGTDVDRWRSLGVLPDRLHITGSIKFDHTAAPSASRAGEFREMLLALGIRGDAPIIVGGSTFPGEESVLVELLPALRAVHSDVFLILVPRHIERVPEILREIAPLGLRVALRSRLPGAASSADLLLVDTTGELRDWYALATVVFVGKSLTAVGGQNPVEPAVLGKPIIFGPRMDNFRGIVEHLLTRGGAVQVTEPPALRTALHELLASEERRADLGARARASVSAHEGATERAVMILREVSSTLPERGENPCGA